MRHCTRCALIAVLGLAGVPNARASHEAAEYLPADLLITVTVEAPDRQLESIRGFLDGHALARDGVRTALASKPGLVRAQIFLAGVCATAGTDAWAGPGALLGSELVIGFEPRENRDMGVIVAAVANDDALRTRMLDTLHAAAGITIDGAPAPGIAREIEGVQVLQLGTLFECRIGPALLVANDADLLRRALTAHANGANRLVDDSTWIDAAERIPEAAVTWARLHAPTMRAILDAQADAAAESGEPPARIGQPLFGVLLGGWSHALAHAEVAVAWLEPEQNPDGGLALHLQTEANEFDPALRGFCVANDVGAPPVHLDGVVAEVMVRRAWADLFAERERFLTLDASTQFANFNAGLTNLMGNMDFAEQVLAQVTGPVQLVVQRADLATGFTPSPRLPSFALIAPLDVTSAPDLARRLTSGALSTASVVNMDRTQKGGEGYVVDVEEYRSHRLVTMSLEPPQTAGGDEPDVVDMRYNFTPAAGVFGDRFVIASTRDAALRIADAVLDGNQGAARTTDVQDRLQLDGEGVRQSLRDAREELVAQRMIKESQTRAEAERDIDTILDLIQLAESLELESDLSGNIAHATARLRFAPASD